MHYNVVGMTTNDLHLHTLKLYVITAFWEMLFLERCRSFLLGVLKGGMSLYTVEPPNKRHFGANSFVPCREVVPIEGKINY